MKLLTLAIIFMSFTANAYEGGLQETFLPDITSKEYENKVKYATLLEDYETKKEYTEGLVNCAAKNKYYVPSHGSADADGCFDVIETLNNQGLLGTRLSAAGYVSGLMSAQQADLACTQAFAGSRALRADDVRYLSGSLSTLRNASSTLINTSLDVLLYEPRLTIKESNHAVYSDYVANQATYDSGNVDFTCSNYTSANASKKTLALDLSVSTQRKVVAQACNHSFQVICVFN